MPEEQQSLPPLDKDEYIHVEYLQLNTEDGDAWLSNMVTVVYSREELIHLLTELAARTDVYAVHVRRYEQPEQGVHLYDESQPLAQAQGEAYAQRKRADTLHKLLGAAVESNRKIQQALDDEERRNVVYSEAKDAVIDELVRMLESIREVAVRDQRDAVFTEPADIARMTRVNIQALRESEVRKAKERLKAREEYVDHSPTITGDEDEG